MPIQMTFREVNVGLTTVTSLVHEEIRCLMSSSDSAATQLRSEGWVITQPSDLSCVAAESLQLCLQLLLQTINMSAAITRISCTWRHLTVVEGSGEGRGMGGGGGFG